MECFRLCIGCYKIYNSKELIKIKFNCGKLYINPKVYLDGRSAYLCYKKDCIDIAKNKKKFEKSFKGKIKITEDIWFFLEEVLKTS